jgi:hypothetical protein
MPKKIKEIYALIDKDEFGNEYVIHLSDDKNSLPIIKEHLKKQNNIIDTIKTYKFSHKEAVKNET